MMMNMLIADNRIQVYNIIFSFFMISFSFRPIELIDEKCTIRFFMMEGIFPMLSAVITSHCVILPMVM